MSIALLAEPAGGSARNGHSLSSLDRPSTALLSDKRLRANRRNARQSTGPRTAEGKARSSKNALTHGMFTDDTIVEGEDPQQFRDYRLSLLRGLNPHCPLELEYAEQFVQASWKLKRLQKAEAELFEERFERAREHRAEDAIEPTAGSIMAEMFSGKERALERLQIYQRRLQVMRDKAMDQINRLQTKWPNEPRSEFMWQLLEREGAAKEENGENEATGEARDVNAEPTEGLANQEKRTQTDQAAKECVMMTAPRCTEVNIDPGP